MILNTEDYKKECIRLLEEGNTYEKLRGDPTNRIKEDLKKWVGTFKGEAVLKKKEKEFLLIEYPSIPVFYTLPKIHKSLINPPGRPIVSGVNSITSNLSGMIDFYLQPLMKDIKSYLKDTGHIIRILEGQKWDNNCILVTADVSSLYTIINHSLGVQAVKWALEKTTLEEENKRFILEGIQFILGNNFFWFNDQFYIQRSGTAMGTKFAPPYANIFMSWWEENFVYKHPLAIKHLRLYRRYIDDIIWIWNGDTSQLDTFCNELNVNELGIKLTFNINQKEVAFLDLIITGEGDGISTRTYRKLTDTNALIPQESNHHPLWLNSVPISQFTRMKRNCTKDEIFEQESEILKEKFLQKGYQMDSINTAYSSVQKKRRDTLIKERTISKGKNPFKDIPFITQFHSGYRIVERIIKKHWNLLSNDNDLIGYIKKKPKFLYRRARNIKNEVVRSAIEEPKKKGVVNSKGFFRCGNCVGCRKVKMQDRKIENLIISNKEYVIREFITCDSKNCVYLMECSCPKVYIGRTTRKLKERWYEHIRGIDKGEILHPFSQHMKEVHSGRTSDIKRLMGVKKIEGSWRKKDVKGDLARCEMEFIFTYDTLHPRGLNNNFEMKWFLEG